MTPLQRLAYYVRYRKTPPFDFVVEYPDAELAAAWRVPVEFRAFGSQITTAEELYTIANAYVPPRQMERLLAAQVKRALAGPFVYRETLREIFAARTSDARTRAAAADRADEIAGFTRAFPADEHAAITVRSLLKYGALEAPLIIYNASRAHAMVQPGYDVDRKAVTLRFARRAVNVLRQSVPPPTWARLLSGRG